MIIRWDCTQKWTERTQTLSVPTQRSEGVQDGACCATTSRDHQSHSHLVRSSADRHRGCFSPVYLEESTRQGSVVEPFTTEPYTVKETRLDSPSALWTFHLLAGVPGCTPWSPAQWVRIRGRWCIWVDRLRNRSSIILYTLVNHYTVNISLI